MKVYGFLILISMDFYDFLSLFFFLGLVSIKKIYQTLKAVLKTLTFIKNTQLHKHYNFDSLLSIWKYDQTWYFMLDKLLVHKDAKHSLITVNAQISAQLQISAPLQIRAPPKAQNL